MDTVAHTDQQQFSTILLMSDIGSYQGPDAGGIHIRDIREIKNQDS